MMSTAHDNDRPNVGNHYYGKRKSDLYWGMTCRVCRTYQIFSSKKNITPKVHPVGNYINREHFNLNNNNPSHFDS